MTATVSTATERFDAARTESTLRRTPMLLPLVAAIGLATVGASFYMERTASGPTWADAVFWVGFAVIVVPLALRLLDTEVTRTERIASVVTFGALFYAIKVLRDPTSFVMSDEFTHYVAAQQMVATHSLFPPINLVGAGVASGYPGLEVAAVAIHEVSGLSLFVGGLIVIGLARILVMLALFLLFEEITGSPRAAGLGAVMFAANTNFLYWSAQFSYESLSLPMFVATLYLLARRARRSEPQPGLALAIFSLQAAIAATHHVTSYALCITMILLSLMSLRRCWRPWRMPVHAAFGTALSLFWFFVAAPSTGSYLGFIFGQAYGAVKDVAEQKNVHAPFATTAGSLATPRSEEVVAFIGVLLLVIAVLYTLRHARAFAAMRTPLGMLLGVAAILCLALYPLRVLPGAWETANRAQEFFFVGVAFVLGLGLERVVSLRLRAGRRRTLVGVVMSLIIASGVIEGWPAPLRLSQPLEVAVAGRAIVPQGYSVARWAVTDLPRDSGFVADEGTGRELAVDRAHFTAFGPKGGTFAQILQSPLFPAWQRQIIRRDRFDYLVVDRRRLADNDQAVYFFQPADDPSGGAGYFPAAARAKFAALPTVSLISDSGDISVYNVRTLNQAPPACTQVGLPSVSDGVICRTRGGVQLASPAHGVVTLPAARIRYLGAEAQRRTSGLWVSVLFQYENMARRPWAAVRSPGATLIAGSRRFRALRTVPGRTDNLTARTEVSPTRAREASVTFVVTGRAIRRVRSGHGIVYLSAPRVAGPRTTLLVRIGRPRPLR